LCIDGALRNSCRGDVGRRQVPVLARPRGLPVAFQAIGCAMVRGGYGKISVHGMARRTVGIACCCCAGGVVCGFMTTRAQLGAAASQRLRADACLPCPSPDPFATRVVHQLIGS
jgi:hypothetical protein